MPEQNSLLRRLCQYYLACIAHDHAGGVSVSARNTGDPEYVELPRIELDATTLPGWDEELAAFVNGKRTGPNSTLRLGYPVLSVAGRGEGESRKLMPLFLIDLAADTKSLEPEWHTCALNLEALRELEGNGIQFAQHAMLELEEGLGLSVNEEPKPFSQVVERLKLLRPEWPWADPEPEDAPAQPLTASKPGFIYERGIVLRVLRPYTQGLELELQKLAQTPEHVLHGTALGTLLFGEDAAPRRVPDDRPLLEVLPMNPEQRTAVRMALNEPLSVVTGPPGTGKSQVVANLLVNCAWRRRAVLFTSKNNKAVDVVDERVNGLGRKPVMVRLGAKEHRHKLAEHLSYLANGTVSPEELETLRAERAAYDRLGEELAQVDEAERMALELSAQAQSYARELDELGIRTGPRFRSAALAVDGTAARGRLFAARDALLAALPSRQPVWLRLTWPIWRPFRVRTLKRAMVALSRAMGPFSALKKQPAARPEDDEAGWKAHLNFCARVLAAIDHLQTYETSLNALREVDFDELTARRNELQAALVETSGRLWSAWVTAQPALLSPDQHHMLSRYSAVLKSVMDAGDADRLPYEVRREYDRITLDAPEVVSCFAVTALSARNRVPFTPGYFDLVVFDESSQCDIASALPILFRAKRAVIIGDNAQLRHIASLRRDRDATFMVDQHLDATHLDWQYSTQSLFELVAGHVGQEAKIALRDHHRSHPQVVGYSNEAFYNGSLRIVTELPRLRRAETKGPAVRWIDVQGRASRGAFGSVHNDDEVKAVVREVKRLVKKGYTGTIGVVTPFTYQAERIRRELERDAKLWKKLRHDHDFQSATAHGFQGDERDLMLFSIVASNGLHEGAVRFLEDEANVFNVAITRARAELVVVGDLAWCLDAPIAHLAKFAHYTASLTVDAVERAVDEPDVARGRLTPEERMLLEALEAEGLSPQPRLEVEQYRIDLALTVNGTPLAIDVADRSDDDWGAEALEREQLKRMRLKHLGWDVMRFWPMQVRDDLAWCVERVQEWARIQRHGTDWKGEGLQI